MTNMRSGTTMMSGCGILTNGKGTRREYGEFNLDELRVSSGAIISSLVLDGVLSLEDDRKLWIGKNLKGFSGGIFQGTVQAFFWENLRKPLIMSKDR